MHNATVLLGVARWSRPSGWCRARAATLRRQSAPFASPSRSGSSPRRWPVRCAPGALDPRGQRRTNLSRMVYRRRGVPDLTCWQNVFQVSGWGCRASHVIQAAHDGSGPLGWALSDPVAGTRVDCCGTGRAGGCDGAAAVHCWLGRQLLSPLAAVATVTGNPGQVWSP